MMYAKQLRAALTGAIDTRKLAEAWQALHPKDVTKGIADAALGDPDAERVGGGVRGVPPVPLAVGAQKAISPILQAFLSRAWTAISDAVRGVLERLWPEGWVLGQKAAEAVTSEGWSQYSHIDWGDWTPGDYEAAERIAGAGLRELLDAAQITIKSITDSRLEEIADALEATLASDVITIEETTPLDTPTMSVAFLARQLEGILGSPERAQMVAQTEIARAQSAAAESVYAQTGVAEVDWSTADDARVCPPCDELEASNPHALGSVTPPHHPNCRCALLPVLAGAP